MMSPITWHGNGKRGDVFAFAVGDLGQSFFFHFIDADYRVHGYEAALHAVELLAQLVFRRINHHLGFLAKNVVFDFYEAIDLALIDVVGVDLVDLALIVEKHLVDVSRGVAHGATCLQYS